MRSIRRISPMLLALLVGSGLATADCLSGPPSTPTPAPTATRTPTATPTSPPAVGVCGESTMSWHPAVINGCAAGHEHGDPPPRWIAEAGYSVMFHGHFNTSALENSVKHAAMKGFLGTFNGTDLYFRIHAASNPGDRSARFHSYEAWARDPSGAVSHWQGWYNAGDPVTARVLRRNPPLPGDAQRPIVAVVDETSVAQGISCEQWYSAPGEPQWSWDFGWTICGATTYYRAGENTAPFDQSTWVPSGKLGGTRRLEAAWYASRDHPTGLFYATQFGDIVSGPNELRCALITTRFGVSYQNVCLDQYIAPTMREVAFPGNSDQKTFDTTGVKLPN
jgi:hypothetical protein